MVEFARVECGAVIEIAPFDHHPPGWLLLSIEQIPGAYQRLAYRVEENRVVQTAEDLPLESVAEIKRVEIEAAHTAAMPKPQSSINRLLMQGALLAFQAAAVGLSEEEAEHANTLIGLANMVQTIDAHRAELLSEIDAALADGDRDRLLVVAW